MQILLEMTQTSVFLSVGAKNQPEGSKCMERSLTNEHTDSSWTRSSRKYMSNFRSNFWMVFKCSFHPSFLTTDITTSFLHCCMSKTDLIYFLSVLQALPISRCFSICTIHLNKSVTHMQASFLHNAYPGSYPKSSKSNLYSLYNVLRCWVVSCDI